MREVRISDMTMHQAAKSSALSLSFKQKLELAKLLDRLNVSYIELEGLEQAKADSLLIKSIASVVSNAALCVPVRLDGSNIEAVAEALKDAPRARLQVHAAVSPAQIEYVHRLKAPTMLSAVEAAVKACAAVCDDVEFYADDATRADADYLRKIIEVAISAGATTVTIGDAAGKMLPSEFGSFVACLLETIPALGADVSLGICCSDDLYLADACAVAAIADGVNEVKVASYPLGITSLDKIAKVLSEKVDDIGVTAPVRTNEIKRVSSQIAWICDQADSKQVTAVNSADPDESVALTKHDNVEAVMAAVAKLGYELSTADADNVYAAFQRIANKKDSVGSRELDAIVASAALQVPETYVIDNYVVNSGNVIRATARVAIDVDGEPAESVGIGDGPIDAAFMAIEDIAGRHFELDDFQIQAVTEGQEAMAETVIKLQANGKLYSGRGISTDTVGSSIRAFVNALNKIVYEEQN